MKRIIIVLLFSLFFLSCNKSTGIFDPTYFADGFKGITVTGPYSPAPIQTDPTDWVNPPPSPHPTSHPGELTLPRDWHFGPAYPNPVKNGNKFMIDLEVPNDGVVRIYAISYPNQVVYSFTSELAAGYYSFGFDTKDFKIPGIYRFVFESGTLYVKGDVWIQP